MTLSVNCIPLGPDFRQQLNDSVVLAFTGKIRLAKNLLQSVLRRFAKRTPEIVTTVSDLVGNAQTCKDAAARGDLDTFGRCLRDFWNHKKIMAGHDSGVEPPIVAQILAKLQSLNMIRGGSLCGAGGGGFMALIMADGISGNDVKETVKETVRESELINSDSTSADGGQFTWHDCRVSEEGLTIIRLGPDSNIDAFDPSWVVVK
jgi:fucokinase